MFLFLLVERLVLGHEFPELDVLWKFAGLILHFLQLLLLYFEFLDLVSNFFLFFFEVVDFVVALVHFLFQLRNLFLFVVGHAQGCTVVARLVEDLGD